MNLEIELENGREIEINLDISSIDIESYEEEEIDQILRELINEQYPECRNKIKKIYC